jgi:23S rRNA (uracil1939-C5)-methyltransferase
LGRTAAGKVQAGYYRRHSHQLINLNQCPVQDSRLNPLLAEVKQDIEARGWSIYNETRHQGRLRHLSLRIGQRTGEILLTLVSTSWDLPGLSEQAQAWRERYPHLIGVSLNHNPHRTNAIFGGETRSIAGQPYLREIFAGVELYLRPDTFFQINTEAAEVLLAAVANHLDLQGQETLLDAYCGIGTFTLPLAKQVRQAIGIEVHAPSIAQAELNAQHNGIKNVTWSAGKVESALPQLEVTPDIVLLDPPRQGCNPAVIEALRNLQPTRLVYISCQPATLARDLKQLCDGGGYHLAFVQPADFFPQTAHVECAAFLER